jgi:hypothetical protein
MQKYLFERRSSRLAWSLAVIVVIGLVAAYTLRGRFGASEAPVPVLLTDQVIVLRTPGGMLEVAELVRSEEFRWKTEYTCPVIDCARLFGRTISEVRVPAHYTYRLALAAEWRLEVRDGYLELHVPAEVAKLPVAVDLGKLEIRTDKGWLAPDVTAHRESMMKHLGPELDARASKKEYLDAQRNNARKTVAEFARKWMVEQGVDKKKVDFPIRVLFAGDPG